MSTIRPGRAAPAAIVPCPGFLLRAGRSPWNAAGLTEDWLGTEAAPQATMGGLARTRPQLYVDGPPIEGLTARVELDRTGLAAVQIDSRGRPELDTVREVNLDPHVADGLTRRVPHRAGEPLAPCSNRITSSTPPRSSRASSPGAYRVPLSPASPPVPSGPCASLGSAGLPEQAGAPGTPRAGPDRLRTCAAFARDLHVRVPQGESSGGPPPARRLGTEINPSA